MGPFFLDPPMLAALSSVLTLFLLIGVGYAATRRGLFRADSGELLTRVVINLSLPPLMVHHLATQFRRDGLVHAGWGLIIPALSMALSAGIGALVARLGRIPENRRGTFSALFTASNSIFIGMPVNLALFGEAAVPYVLLYYAANTSYFWTFGVHGIERDAGSERPLLSWEHLLRIFSPPILGFLAGIGIVLFGIQLPPFLLQGLKLLGGLTTPLSLLFLGITFADLHWTELRPSPEMGLLFLGRFLVAPGLVLLLAHFIPLPPLMVKVFVIQAAMPAITQAALSARLCGADYRYATVMISSTNLASLAVLPGWMFVLTRFFP